jgi:parallel beta-helix repeat protein
VSGYNGTVQYIYGDWVVNSAESYEDSVIDLRGNLTINTGGALYFKNVTLFMNNTNSVDRFKIQVNTNGLFFIEDTDGNPNTIEDGSLITDSTMDVDTGKGFDPDFRYAFRVYKGTVSIKNSIIEEVGLKSISDYDNSLYVTGTILMDNSTVRDSYNGIHCQSPDSVLIKYSTVKNTWENGITLQQAYNSKIVESNIENVSTYGIDMYYGGNNQILGCNLNDTGTYGMYFNRGNNPRVENNSISNNKYGIYLNIYRTICYVRNNEIDNSNTYAIFGYRIIDSNIYNNRINGSGYGIYIQYGERTVISNNTITNTSNYPVHTYNSKDIYIRNNEINNTKFSSSYAMYCTVSSSYRFIYKHIVIENNTIINAYFGIRLNWVREVTIKNNEISGKLSNYGLFFASSQYLRLENNIIKKFQYGMYFYTTSYNADDITKVYGGNIMGVTSTQAAILQYSYVHFYNVTVNISKLNVNHASSYLNIYFNVDVYVEDTKGPVGGARVTAEYNGTGLDPITKPTDQTGWARSMTVLYMIKRFLVFPKIYQTYNFTSDVSGSIAYADQNYTIDSYKTISITHTINTFPTPPVDLRIEVDYSTIELYWECYVNDLNSYKVFRNDSVGGWEMVEEVFPGGPRPLTLTWQDPGMASQLVEFRYKIQHNDTAGQQELNDEWVIFTDWVIVDYRKLQNQSRMLNGSLIIEEGGDFHLINTSLLMNGTAYSPGVKSIEVRNKGRLVISDFDNDDSTTYDRPFINASEAAEIYQFYVHPGGKLELYNSWIQNASIGDESGYANIYINSDNCTIRNNTIITTNNAIFIDESQDITIEGNVFYNDSSELHVGINVHDSERISVGNNTITNPMWSAINVEDSEEVEIKYNNIMINNYEVSFPNAITLYTNKNILIERNRINGSYNGLQLSYNEDVRIIANRIWNCSYQGMEIFDANKLTIDSNIVSIFDTGFSSRGIGVYDIDELIIINNIIDGFVNLWDDSYGIYINNFYKLQLVNNNIRNASVGVQIYNWYSFLWTDIVITENEIHNSLFAQGRGFDIYDVSDLTLTNNSIHDFYVGIRQRYSENIWYETNSIWNVTYGYALIDNSNAIIINATFPVLPLPRYPIYLNYSSETDIINALFNVSTIRVSDRTCEARIHWVINIRIKDHYGNYIPNIFLRIRSIQGTILQDSFTDPDGYVSGVLLLERIQLYADNITFTPNTFEAFYANHTAFSALPITVMQTIEMQLGNTAPNVYNILINPQRPQTTDDLVLNTNYTYIDVENDLENRTYYKWYKYVGSSLIYEPALDNFTSVPSSYTSKGEVWFCRVTPCDNLDYGNYGTSLTVLIFNTKPMVTSAKLYPETPYSLQELSVEYSYFDIDGDSELGTLFYWYASGDGGSTYQFRATTSIPVLDPAYTNKGELMYVEIEPKDGEDAGDRFQSNIITVGNSWPWLEGINALPDNPSTSDDLTVNYTFMDIDGDSEGNTTFKWLVDTGLGFGFLESGFKTRTVPAGYLTKGDIWMCQVTPHDGEQYGKTWNSTQVKIGNTKPEITNVTIVPGAPKTSQNLTVSYDFYDRDSDIENESLYEWLKWENEMFVKTGLKINELPSYYTAKNDIWVCEITPYDGFKYGEPVRSQVITVTNSAPGALALNAKPVEPTTKDDLYANYNYNDDNGDPESGTIIKWYCDGVHDSFFDGRMTVPSSATSKGELWHFTITPYDGLDFGTVYSSQPVLIKNTRPFILNPTIEPQSPLSDSWLIAGYEIADADNDSIQAIEIQWYMNGIEKPQYFNHHTISPNATEKGQAWKYTIRVSDGLEFSMLYESASVIIKNSPPELEAFPPGNIITINETESVTFQINVNDLDGDLLVVQWFKDRMIASSESNYLFTTDYNSAGNHTINVTVQDWGAGSVMVSSEWTVIVKDSNRAPTLHVNEPLEPNPVIKEKSTLKFQVSFDDPDVEDAPTISWLLDGDPAVGEHTSSYFLRSKGIGTHTVTAKVTDGEQEKTYSWNVTVKESLDIQYDFWGLTWDQWSIVLEALVIGVTGLLAFFGFLRIRKRKGALHHYMKDIEDIMKDWKENPDEAERGLVALADKSEKDFSAGKIEDFHFFLLDRQIKESLREIRQSKLKSGFAALPENLKREMNVMLEDGKITDKEYRTFVRVMSQSEGVTPEDRAELRKLMRSWKDIDTTGADKKVVIKPVSVMRIKRKTKFQASQLGWEDVSKESVDDDSTESDFDESLPDLESEDDDIEDWNTGPDDEEEGV